MQLTHIKIRMKILILLFLSLFIVLTNLNAGEFVDSLMSVSKLQKKLKNKTKQEALYFFTSESVPLYILKKFINEGNKLTAKYNVDLVVVYQGITSKKHEFELMEFFKNMKRENINFSNLTRVIDPNIFKKLSLKKVPNIAYGMHYGNSYPSRAKLNYIINGSVSLVDFFELIIEKEPSR